MRLQDNGGSGSRRIVVPAEVARHIPEGQEFVCELTEDGILFRPLELPEWVRRERPKPTITDGRD